MTERSERPREHLLAPPDRGLLLRAGFPLRLRLLQGPGRGVVDCRDGWVGRQGRGLGAVYFGPRLTRTFVDARRRCKSCDFSHAVNFLILRLIVPLVIFRLPTSAQVLRCRCTSATVSLTCSQSVGGLRQDRSLGSACCLSPVWEAKQRTGTSKTRESHLEEITAAGCSGSAAMRLTTSPILDLGRNWYANVAHGHMAPQSRAT